MVLRLCLIWETASVLVKRRTQSPLNALLRTVLSADFWSGWASPQHEVAALRPRQILGENRRRSSESAWNGMAVCSPCKWVSDLASYAGSIRGGAERTNRKLPACQKCQGRSRGAGIRSLREEPRGLAAEVFFKAPRW